MTRLIAGIILVLAILLGPARAAPAQAKKIAGAEHACIAQFRELEPGNPVPTTLSLVAAPAPGTVSFSVAVDAGPRFPNQQFELFVVENFGAGDACRQIPTTPRAFVTSAEGKGGVASATAEVGAGAWPRRVVLAYRLFHPDLPGGMWWFSDEFALPDPAVCTFNARFQPLRDQLGRVVGTCVANERYHPASALVSQVTSQGLLTYDAQHNWAAFTDGATTWILGPCGLQSRRADERFAWELGGGCGGAAAPAVAPAAATPAPAPQVPLPTPASGGY